MNHQLVSRGISKRIVVIVAIFIGIVSVIVIGSSIREQIARAYFGYSRKQMGFDESLATKREEMEVPRQVYIFPIRTEDEDLKTDSKRWVDNLYYYTITNMHFPDIPFNYVLSTEGEVYGVRENPAINSLTLPGQPTAVLVGVLLDGEINTQQATSLQELLADLNSIYGIQKDEVETVKLAFAHQDTGDGEKVPGLYEIRLVQAGDAFINSVRDAIAGVDYASAPRVDVALSIEDVKYDVKVRLGEKLPVEFTLRNDGTDPLVVGENNSLLLKTADDKDSPFAVSGVWPSLDTPILIDNMILKPEESKIFKFDMFASVLPGSQSQSFHIVDHDGNEIDGTEFTVDFAIERGDAKILEIKDTDTGYLNVRKGPALNSEKVSQVGVGERFVWTEKDGAWYKIKYSDSAEGWVYARYVREL